MRRTKVDMSGMQRKLRQVERNRPRANVETTRALTSMFIEALSHRWPRDTNRSLRGWFQAARQAGARTPPMPSLRPSDRRDSFIDRLIAQVERYENSAAYWKQRVETLEQIKMAWYTSKGRRGSRERWLKGDLEPRIRKAKSRFKKADGRALRAQEELDKARENDTAIIIYGRKRKSGGHRLHTVRDKVYGGSGRVLTTLNDVFIELRNHEPHARFVERRSKAVYRAFGAVRTNGVRRLSKKHAKSLLEGVA